MISPLCVLNFFTWLFEWHKFQARTMCDVKVWYVESKWKSYDMKPWGANKEGKYWKDRWNAEREAGSSVCSTQGADVHKFTEIVIKPRIHTNPHYSSLLILERSSSWAWIWSGFLRKIRWMSGGWVIPVFKYCFGLWNPQIQDVLRGPQRCAIMIWTYLNILSVSCGGAFAGKCLAAEAGILAFWWNMMICWKSKHVSTLPFCCKQPRRTNMITAIFVLDFCFVFGSVWEIVKTWQNSRMAWDWEANSNGFYTAWYTHYNTMRIPY